MGTRMNLWQLLNAGDWAVAHGDEEALARVCGAVAEATRGQSDTARQAQRVATLAMRNPEEASRVWANLAAQTRARATT